MSTEDMKRVEQAYERMEHISNRASRAYAHALNSWCLLLQELGHRYGIGRDDVLSAVRR